MTGQIVALKKAGLTQIQISHQLSISQSIVSRKLTNYNQFGIMKAIKQTGRPRKSSQQSDRLIHRIATQDPRVSSSFIASRLPPSAQLSCRTIRRRISI